MAVTYTTFCEYHGDGRPACRASLAQLAGSMGEAVAGLKAAGWAAYPRGDGHGYTSYCPEHASCVASCPCAGVRGPDHHCAPVGTCLCADDKYEPTCPIAEHAAKATVQRYGADGRQV